MLYYDRINISEGIDINGASASKGCVICRYWHFLDKEFSFQSSVFNDRHDLLTMSFDINSIVVLIIHCVEYCSTIFEISKCEAINLLKMLL